MQRIGNLIKLVILMTMCCLLSQAAHGNQTPWPQWRGMQRDGHSECVGLLDKWPAAGPKQLWKTEGLGAGYSSVSVTHDRIYTTGQIEKKDYLFAMNKQGRLLWQREIGPGWFKNYASARSTPTVVDKRIYVMTGAGTVGCFEAESGRRLWSVDIVKRFAGRVPRWGMAESLVILSDRLFCTPGGKDASIVALNRHTGETLWTSQGLNDASGYCSPLIVELNHRPILLTMTEKAAIGMDTRDGTVLWRHGHVNSFKVNANTPIYRDGRIYVTSGYGKGGELLEVSDQGTVSVRWSDKTLECHHGGVVLVDGYIYGSAGKTGKWICLDFNTGRIMYETRGVGKGAVTYADGMLYCYGENGKVALVPASPHEHKIVSSFRINSGKGRHWAHPVVADKRLYIRHGEVLMAYDIAKR